VITITGAKGSGVGEDKKTEEEEEATTVSFEFDIRQLDNASDPCLLQQVEGPGSPHEYSLSEDTYVLGRSRKADITLQSDLLSRTHVKLEKRESGYVMTDLESLNGVFLNGVRAHSATLCEGDTLQIGEIVFVYHEGNA